MKRLFQWWRKRQMDRAQELLESYGLSVVMIKEVAGSKYLVSADGSHLKLVGQPPKGKK